MDAFIRGMIASVFMSMVSAIIIIHHIAQN